jgi:hypothetical protein
MTKYVIRINPAASESGELGSNIFPHLQYFKVGDLKKNADKKGIDGIRASRGIATQLARSQPAKTQPVETKQVTLVGVGTLRTYSEPSSFELKVSQELTAFGWTVTGTSIKNQVNFEDKTQWLRFASPLLGYVAPTWNYSINLSINALASHNAEEIKNRIANYLGQYFSDLKLAVAGQTFDTGSGNNPGSNQKPGESSVDAFLKSLGSSLGLSTPLVVGGLLLVTIVVLKR